MRTVYTQNSPLGIGWNWSSWMAKKREAVWFCHSKMIKKGLLSPNVDTRCHPREQIPEHVNTRTLQTQLLPIPSGCKLKSVFVRSCLLFQEKSEILSSLYYHPILKCWRLMRIVFFLIAGKTKYVCESCGLPASSSEICPRAQLS